MTEITIGYKFTYISLKHSEQSFKLRLLIIFFKNWYFSNNLTWKTKIYLSKNEPNSNSWIISSLIIIWINLPYKDTGSNSLHILYYTVRCKWSQSYTRHGIFGTQIGPMFHSEQNSDFQQYYTRTFSDHVFFEKI